MNRTPESATNYRTPTHEQIARRAYQLWERSGRPENTALKDWLAAERALQFPTSIDEELQSATAPVPPLPPTLAQKEPIAPPPRTGASRSARPRRKR